jgi:transcriptional regulator with XRE-family HTH domain
MKQTYQSLNELLEALSPFINQSAFARITGVNMGQMRQYASNVRNPSRATLDKIVANLHLFALELGKIEIS